MIFGGFEMLISMEIGLLVVFFEWWYQWVNGQYSQISIKNEYQGYHGDINQIVDISMVCYQMNNCHQAVANEDIFFFFILN